jgi:AraC family mar-sox-rob regulon transcriptional activator
MKNSAATRRRVIRLLLTSSLENITASQVAARLEVSSATLRRHLQAEHTSYQLLLDAVRGHRCRKTLARRWLPGKCIAGDLGFRETNSFYRAFSKWMGKSYTEYKKELLGGSAQQG